MMRITYAAKCMPLHLVLCRAICKLGRLSKCFQCKLYLSDSYTPHFLPAKNIFQKLTRHEKCYE